MYNIIFKKGIGFTYVEVPFIETDYMCAKCQSCFFYEYVDMGMDGHVHACNAHEPKNFYNNAHSMKWASANDCKYNKEIERAYCRECPEYRSKKEIYEKVLSEVKKEKK